MLDILDRLRFAASAENRDDGYSIYTDAADEITRLRIELEAARVDAGVMNDLIQLVEGIAGAMNHGTWRDDNGSRLKDTKEWCNFYVAANKEASHDR